MGLQLSIPLDEDGYIEMECDYCKSRFMLHETVYSDENNLHFFCPICGLPNNVNTFFCSEVLEAAEQMVANYLADEMQKIFTPSRHNNKHGLLRITLKAPKREPEKELYSPANEYVSHHHYCCDVDVKALELDTQIGLYCPICGGAAL